MRISNRIAAVAVIAASDVVGTAVPQPVEAGQDRCNYAEIGRTSTASYSGYTTGTSSNTYRWASPDPDTDNNRYGNGLNVQNNTNSARHRDANYARFCGFTGEYFTGGLSFSVSYAHPGFYRFSQNRIDQSIRMRNGAC